MLFHRVLDEVRESLGVLFGWLARDVAAAAERPEEEGLRALLPPERRVRTWGALQVQRYQARWTLSFVSWRTPVLGERVDDADVLQLGRALEHHLSRATGGDPDALAAKGKGGGRAAAHQPRRALGACLQLRAAPMYADEQAECKARAGMRCRGELPSHTLSRATCSRRCSCGAGRPCRAPRCARAPRGCTGCTRAAP